MSLPAHRFTVRLTAGPSTPSSKVYARKLSFAVGDPVSFDAEHAHITALEYLLGALAADIAGGLRVLGRKRRIEVDEVEVLVNAELHDSMVYLRVVDHQHGNAGIARIEVKVYISSLAEDEDVRRLWEEVLECCPVINTLKPAVALSLAHQQVF